MGIEEKHCEHSVRLKKKTLLEKYEIPIEHLSFEYVSSCANSKELGRMIRILRSGEEGYYPELLKKVEDKLKIIEPTNPEILEPENPILKKSMLSFQAREKIESDMDEWVENMKVQEKDFAREKSDPNRAELNPEIRKFDKLQQNKTTVKKEKRISLCDYAAWDKYDVDTELTRIDLHEEQRKIQAKNAQNDKKEKSQRENFYPTLTLTTTELKVMAEREREKGNEAFRAGDYREALKFYNSSIKLVENNIYAYNNRAMTHIKLGNYESAVEDCNKVLINDNVNIKALLRRASALEHLGKKSDAFSDYETILMIEATNKTALRAISRLKNEQPKSVRMKIKDERSCSSDTQIFEKRDERICFCNNAPRTSRQSNFTPHYKSSYCLAENQHDFLHGHHQFLKKFYD